jgi:parallel beta-helix repeat protein
VTKTRDLADLGGGFIQAGTGAVQRTVESKLQDVVSVRDFGAVGDGVADDTAAIQAAIDSGKTAYVPRGVYKITNTINLLDGYKAIVGEPNLAAFVKSTPGPAIRVSTSVGTVVNEYSRVENLYLQCTATPTFPVTPQASDAGIVLDGNQSTLPGAVGNARIINVRIGNWAVGIYSSGTTGVRIEGCFVQLLTDYTASPGFTAANKFIGIHLDNSIQHLGHVNASIELVDNDVVGVGTPTAVTSAAYYVNGSVLADVFFDRCEAGGVTYGYWISTSGDDKHWNLHIRRPIVDAYRKYGVLVDGADGPGGISIVGGYFVGTGVDANACIYVNNSAGVVVTGGTQLLGYVNNTGNDNGISIVDSKYCSIVGNNFQNLVFGVTVSNSSGCTIDSNVFFASATVTEPLPALQSAIRVINGSTRNIIASNTIAGKDGVDKYSEGILVNSDCPNNVVVGNSIDLGTVLFPIKDLTNSTDQGDATFKNRLINGSFNIWQRGTSLTSNLAYLADRWRVYSNVNATISQSVSAPAGSRYSLSVAAGSAATFLAVGQQIEYNDCWDLQGATVAITFWAKANNSNAASTALVAKTRTAPGVDSVVIFGGSEQNTAVNVTTSWQKYTVSQQLPATFGALSFEVYAFSLAAGDGFSIANVQLEKSTYASSFEIRPYAQELALCQRYFEVTSGIGAGYAGAGGALRAGSIFFSTTKRTSTPAITTSNVVYGNASTLVFEKLSNSKVGFYVTATGIGTYQVDFDATVDSEFY